MNSYFQRFKDAAYRAFEWVYYEPQHIAEEWRVHSNRRSMLMILFGGGVALLLYMYVIAPPRDFPIGVLVPVKEGATVMEIGEQLQMQGVIREAEAFRVAVILLGRDRGVRAGDYLFKEPKDVLAIARAITTGAYGLEPIRIRIPEGATTKEMAKVYAANLQRFDAEKFMEKAQPQEGFLFPDTYFFLPNATEDTVITAMRQNFDDKIKELEKEINTFNRPIRDVVIMASLLEKEARNFQDRRMISGVLWRRIKIDMALQVDAAFLYSLGRTTFTLTREDLQNRDDPYNTYVHKGLPPGAIGSPSLDSIRAAVTPIDQGYLFYLADRNFVTHYSKTYEEHLEKKRIYIDS